MNPTITGLTLTELPATIATPDPGRALPSTKRILKADGVDLISFTFSPGQVLGDHQAAYPIIVHCISGEVDFTIGTENIRMTTATLLHLDEGILHHVQAVPGATEPATILVSLLTGERQAS